MPTLPPSPVLPPSIDQFITDAEQELEGSLEDRTGLPGIYRGPGPLRKRHHDPMRICSSRHPSFVSLACETIHALDCESLRLHLPIGRLVDYLVQSGGLRRKSQREVVAVVGRATPRRGSR